MLKNKENLIAVSLVFMGWIIIAAALIAGATFGNELGEINWFTFLCWSLAGISLGLVLLGLAEIVEFLNIISDRIREDKPHSNSQQVSASEDVSEK
ncbi:hypothetical protein [Metabacillus arenae]|uniref:Uncharacterized protein n=1 Tax=Metabacillus arenae TaxID=2771434 RepID=A0A926RX02_9BACI|nr:hypothetical protein [Metabacillus arenae]MBD1380120.1 hypothetical protein [Metabacillus arenae]